MNDVQLERLLHDVAAGRLTTTDALTTLREFPVAELEEASLDTHRALRIGFPEVVLAGPKTDGQLDEIVGHLLTLDGNILLTRIEPDRARALLARHPHPSGRVSEKGRLLIYEREPVPMRGRGTIAVLSAGTSDSAVAEEAAVVAELMGNTVQRVVDVGVAGIHRLLRHRDLLRDAAVFIVVAGMEGALPSVVAGLVGDRPIVAVPTSVGYGASFGGLAALLGMLNSCAAGVTVVNIDNGFGAGYAAALMNRDRSVR
jgi:NCAIR mutase (PurE)-related protein